MSLNTEHHPNRDFFIADIFDQTPYKDDMASMGYPMFVLSKNKDMRSLTYKKDNVTIEIKPNIDGLPTIFDKDVLLYCGSLLMKEINAGRIPPRTLRISSHDLLVSTNRQTNDDGYRRLKQALDRLKGVTIKTNIKTNKREHTSAFGLIEQYDIIESSKVKNRMVRLEITLAEWFYNSLIGKEVLTISRDYFRLGKPIERRLYEIARKHCGNQSEWKIGLKSLMEKTGSTGTLRLFRSRLKEIITDNHLPEYSMDIDAKDNVIFSWKDRNNSTKQIALPLDDMPRITNEAIERAREITINAGTGWDFNVLRTEFTDSLASGAFNPQNVNGAFINFVKKKTSQKP